MTLSSGPSETTALSRETLASLQAETTRRADFMLALSALLPGRLGGVLVDGASPDAAAHMTRQLAGWTRTKARAHRLPIGISDDGLSGGLDLAATLAAGRPVSQSGILAAADGGCLVVPMAERLPRRTAAQIARALDCASVSIERDGVSFCAPTRFVVMLLADTANETEAVPDVLSARIAFRMPGAFLPSHWTSVLDEARLDGARALMDDVELDDRYVEAMARACDDLGISNLRVLDFACATMRGLAALGGDLCVQDEHAQLAASLVLGPRTMPVSNAEESAPPPPPPESDQTDTGGDDKPMDDLAELVVSSARYTARIDAEADRKKIRRRMKGEVATGKSGDLVDSWQRGARLDSRPGDPRRQGRLDLIATLRAAAPWQKIRPQREGGAAISIRAADFRLKRFRHKSEAVVIFAVDASGSAAMNRLADAKGAIEFLLSGCYARRESVAVLAFRRQSADVLLPPTRSLTRVKRSLAGLPGGGGTPLAAGISAAQAIGEQELRRRRSPYIVFLSDGQANVGLDGAGGREKACADASQMARRLKGAHLPVLFLDTSRRPSAEARRFSEEMGAVYRPLPFADGKTVSDTVRSALLS